MKRYLIYLLFLASFVFVVNCTSKESEKPKNPREVAIATNKNQFGLHIPRGLTKTSDSLSPGYVMFRPSNSASVYLINREGLVVHEWKGNYELHPSYLNDDGSIYVQAVDPDFPVFGGGGEAGRIQHISWDSKMLWDFEYANEQHHAHHDIAVKPNGNVLTIAWEARTPEEAKQAGRKPELTPQISGIWPSTVVEIKPEGKTGGEIVWKWQVWDHLIQDYDNTKDNYGDVEAHPELLDINVGDSLRPTMSQDSVDKLIASKKTRRNRTVDNQDSDIYHFNAINYNADLEQVVVSSPHLNEIFILDQSTTTEEAKGHNGGRWGKGGDFLYRWGNPENYRHGDSTDQQLFGQHDVRWIEKGMPGAGHLTVYNNDIPYIPDSLSYSAVYELVPPVDADGNYASDEKGRYGPEGPVWKYIAPDTLSFYGSFISGAHRMANGNTFINEGPKGRFFEVTPQGETVWEYYNPYRGNIRHSDGDVVDPVPLAYWQFRATFIPADHPGLKGRDLKPLDPQPEIFKLPPKEETK